MENSDYIIPMFVPKDAVKRLSTRHLFFPVYAFALGNGNLHTWSDELFMGRV